MKSMLFILAILAALAVAPFSPLAAQAPQFHHPLSLAPRLRLIEPRDYVRDFSLVVPIGQTFVLTALGCATGCGQVQFMVNGIPVMDGQPGSASVGVMPAPAGIFARAGDTISVTGGYFLGYLAEDGKPCLTAHTPDPSTSISLTSGQVPYIVPAGKILLVASAGSVVCNATGYVRINGSLWLDLDACYPQSVVTVPGGFTVRAGETISFVDVFGAPKPNLILNGYLVDE